MNLNLKNPLEGMFSDLLADQFGQGSFTEKDILITILLDGQEAISFPGLAAQVSVDKSGCPAFPKANVTLHGLKITTMERLTHLGFKTFSLKRNKISIQAGQKGKTLSLIFKGEITNAWADFNSVPDPTFKIEARCGLFPALIPQPPISVKGVQSASDILESITKEIGYTFENNDVTASIKDCVIAGDPVTKLRNIANTVGANLIFDDEKVVIVDKKASRKNQATIPLINSQNGMIGYPTFSNNGITVSTFFRPELKIGANFKLESIVPQASGTWKIVSLKHELSANDPNSSGWKTVITGVFPRW